VALKPKSIKGGYGWRTETVIGSHGMGLHRAGQHAEADALAKGAQMVLSPWHLHRRNCLWNNPDGFDPAWFQTEHGKTCFREAYIPFSTGSRVYTGTGFAMVEGVFLSARDPQGFSRRPNGPGASGAFDGQIS